MLPCTLSFLLLFICLSSGMSASLVRRTSREEDGPPVPTTFRVNTSAVVGVPSEVDTVPAGGPVVDTAEAEAVAEALVTHEPVADAAVADEGVAEEPVEDTPVADALVADAPVDALIRTEEEKEALITEAMIKELSAQVEKEDLAEETEIQDAILKELADQETLGKAVEPTEEAADADAPAEDPGSSVIPVFEAQEEDSGWGLASVRESLQAANGYFDSLVELMGGRNGVCQYKCKYGKTPVHRYGYVTPEPNGCSSNLLGFQFDIGIPAMTQCCNQLDSCYDTCGSNKYRCDSKYRWCLHAICSDLKKSLGFVSKVKACETVADALYNTVWTLGCRSFMNSQREACYCEGEERDEL